MIRLTIFLTVLLSGQINQIYGQTLNPDSVYTKVDSMAAYPDGEYQMFKWMLENLKYPTAAKDAGIQGIVLVSFIVEKDGRITDIKILRGIGTSCDNEVLALIGQFPNWTPATKDGKPVRSQITLPVRFSLRF